MTVSVIWVTKKNDSVYLQSRKDVGLLQQIERQIYLDNGTLESDNPFTEYIFSERGERVHTYCFRNRLKTVCQKTGCVIKSPHKIRKTYGSILLDNNIDNRLIIGQMGHTSILCTENYYHRNRRNLENKQQIISGISEFKI